MDYKVLYRKYRPDDFSSIIGQEYIVSILKNAIKREKISHAYIFSGPRGTGKTSTAKVFAKAINCLNPTENGPCNECESCKNFKENADIIEIDAASNNGVDEIREIINNIKLAPAYSKYKVYIIDEVHMLSTSAFNALLLTLEEPPKHVVFILATTNIEAVPITILSRCQRFDFHKISTKDIINRLEYVVKNEQIAIDSEALEEIAYLSEGGMRDALSILDQLSSTSTKITATEVISHFGSVSKKQITDLYECILNNNVDKFSEMMENFKNLAIDYKILIKKILEKIEMEALNSKKNNNYQGLEYDKLKEMAFDLAKISNYVNININPYQLIEIVLLKYFTNNKIENNKTPNLEAPEPKDTPLKSSVPEEPRKEPVKKEADTAFEKYIEELIKIRVNNCFSEANKEKLNNLKQIWPEFINNLTDKTLLNYVIDSNVVAASSQVAILTTASESTTNLLNHNLNILENQFHESYQLDYKFIALTEATWHEQKEIYINNLKNKKSYTYLEEPKPPHQDDTPKVSNLEETAFAIFDKDKIEIK